MATCFDNIISFRGKCDDIEPTSTLWTDKIGLHKQEMEKYFQLPYQNVDDFFADQLDMSINDVQNHVYTSMLPKYRSTSIIDNARIGYTLDNMILKTGSVNKYRTLEVELCEHNSPIEFFLSEFSLFLNTSGSVLIKVYDLNQNKMIDSFTVVAVADQRVTVYPNKKYQTDRRKLNLAFAYDSTLYDSYETRLSQTGCSSCSGTNTYNKLNGYISVRAGEINASDDFIISNIESLDHTSGMSMVYSVNCNHKDWICSIANLMATPILYRTAFNIVNYGLLSSDRQNSKTLENTAKLKERVAYFDFKYLESMKDILQSMKPPTDNVCYVCNDRMKTVFAM